MITDMEILRELVYRFTLFVDGEAWRRSPDAARMEEELTTLMLRRRDEATET